MRAAESIVDDGAGLKCYATWTVVRGPKAAAVFVVVAGALDAEDAAAFVVAGST